MTSAFTRVPSMVALAALACLAGRAQAQQPAAYPVKPIQLIAQQPPGSGSDAMTRVWADCAARELGQPVVVQNKPGANGILAVNYLKAQPADGYNLLSIGMSQMTITPYVYKQQPYDPLRDFDGVAVLGTSPLVLAVPAGQGIASLADLQKLARSTPGGVNFGSPGKGSPAHLLTSALIEKLGVPGTHVPFVGEGAGLTALMGQQIHAMTLVIGTAAAQVKAGKLVPLALFGAQRSPLLPDVPTIAEALPSASDLARPAWIAVVAKAGTPPELLNRLNAVTEKCRGGDSQYKARLEAMNVTLTATAPADARTWAARDAAVWRPLIDKLGLATE
ncbi:tripartite-type tricarboxylate transporter receptor subunit TctC [Acidovorax sp. 100]|uniref:Bug family tripartite tricarboxylate transporter substrate binding protein n=1 Tax=Acidovorax sp. 100 TaxID=2135635 RepID=UPI000EF9F3FC|nr:tripartite tricarboxylate transporter substrate binding protein [Acidovorax sp. 100]RMA59859.1 tripartite-type tricarboxylate transporter receptor subunit TctC [Acidovorax sp. 100]